LGRLRAGGREAVTGNPAKSPVPGKACTSRARGLVIRGHFNEVSGTPAEAPDVQSDPACWPREFVLPHIKSTDLVTDPLEPTRADCARLRACAIAI